nr:hypothetical protein GCM10025699_09990 [Microbacterium flavescens]
MSGRTSAHIRLVTRPGDFISRSEAKRLATEFETSGSSSSTSKGLDLIGPGFADELLRVWAGEHPNVELRVAGASRSVQFMIDRALRSR